MADGQQGGQNVQEIIKVLKKKGMSSSDLMQLFGPVLGVGAGNNYDQLFAQYMPTFTQINQYEPENSLRRSIAAEVMAGTPIWQIEEGISNAITAGDPGVSPSARYEDYVGLAKTLTNEYQDYSTKAGKDDVFSKYNIPRPEERYTVETFFPDAMKALADIEKANPRYKTGAVGSGAKLPPRMTGAAASVPSTGMDALATLQAAKSAINKAQNFSVGGTTYTPEQLRDEIIPKLENDAKQQDKQLERLRVLQDKFKTQMKTQVRAAEKAAKDAPFQRNTRISSARAAFEGGGSSEEYRARLNKIEQDYKATLDALEKLKNTETPTDLYGLLKATTGEVKTEEPNFFMPGNKSAKFTSSASGPGGYVGPAGGESTMARTFDPYEMEIRKGVVPVLQERLNKSGRTPQLDALYRLAQSGLLGK